MDIKEQFAGNDNWEINICRHEQLVHTQVWKGQSNFTLEKFIDQHRNAFVSMQAVVEHVTYQLPNKHSSVGYLLDAIHNSDAGLQASTESDKIDNDPSGLQNDFKSSAAHLLPYYPVQNKWSDNNKRGAAEIPEVNGDDA